VGRAKKMDLYGKIGQTAVSGKKKGGLETTGKFRNGGVRIGWPTAQLGGKRKTKPRHKCHDGKSKKGGPVRADRQKI